MSGTLEKRLHGEIRSDLVFNYLSFVIMVVVGFVIDAYISIRFGPRLFGVFNQVSAIYLVATQFAVGGIHFSAGKYLAEYIDDSRESAKVFSSAWFATLLPSLLLSILLYSLRYPIGQALEEGSSDIAYGVGAVSLALLFFSLNKTVLSALNGQKRMREFAVAQALRYTLICGSIISLPIITGCPHCLLFGYLTAELLLFLGLSLWIGIVRPISPIKSFLPSWKWITRHLSFGARGFATGVLVEANTRIDILMLGFFCDDTTVGIYSLASRIGEGFLNVLVVIKRNINPVLVELVHSGNNGVKRLVQKTLAFVYPASAAFGVIIYFTFPLALRLLGFDLSFLAGRRPLLILLAGIVASSGFMVFDNLLMQAGKPGLQTLLFGVAVALNCFGNASLIPILGMEGAAAATSASYIGSVVLLIIISRRSLKLTLF